MRIVALQAVDEGGGHGAVEEGIFAVDFFAAAPAGVAVEIGLGSPEHEDLAVVFRGLGDEARLIAFDAGGLADEVGIPGGAHAGRLRKLRGGDGRAAGAGLALDYAVNAFGAADVGNAEARYRGVGSQAVDLFVDGHEREEIVDALLGGKAGIIEGVARLLGEERCKRNS